MTVQPSLTPHAFVTKWRKVALTERSSYQQHFLDLCHLVGHPTPAEADPTGESFTFEAGATKQKGGQGWADVWKKGFFALEYKGKHANLDRAYAQVLQYRESLQNPPLLVVCDTSELRIHSNFTNTVKQVVTITLDDLLTPTGMQRLRDLFFAPEAFKSPQKRSDVTVEAARQFAELATHLRKWEGTSATATRRIAHFLIRLLFCLFAEDIGLLPNGLFSRLIAGTRTRPKAFTAQLGQLFAAMADGGFFGTDEIPYFNGKLFNDADVLELDSDALAILHRVSKLDWSAIEPAILGTLFERSLDPAKRAQLGAHYTDKDDILLIVQPVLMAPLERRWAVVAEQARALAATRDALPASTDRAVQRKRDGLTGEIQQLLQGFAAEIAGTRVLDPACGSGNFLYVALKQLLDLEKQVIALAGDLAAGMFLPSVSPEQLRGIELDAYAHELAQVTVWIGYIQWLRDNGFGQPSQPILKPLDTIMQMDAILAVDSATGRPVEPTWPDADVIIGNPPFLGGYRMRQELGDAYVEQLFSLYTGRVPAPADFVTYWFERCRYLLSKGYVQRAGLLATQSIRAGVNRVVLANIKATGDIFFAWSDREWKLSDANVRVAMIGFDNGAEQEKYLDGHLVTSIHPNLTSAVDTTQAQRLSENRDIAYVGSLKTGSFDIDSQTAAVFLTSGHNPHGRPNSDVVKPSANGIDIVGRKRHRWIIDFPPSSSLQDAALYEKPFEYIRQHVYPERVANRRSARAERWWIHGDPAPAMRNAISGLVRYIATPRVAKHRVFVWLQTPTLPDYKLCVIAREDDYFFGVLHSRLHETWSLATSSRHGDGVEGGRPAYTPTTCFETFPFPWAPGTEPVDDARVQAIAAAAKRLVELRDNWLNPPGTDEAELKKRTLTNLYNARPTWLAMAHAALDAAVCAAYGWPTDMSDEQILERLLALNLERAGRG